ncbi:MAG TPA: hypothetical protein VF647_04450 [Longimicrobium sp.]
MPATAPQTSGVIRAIIAAEEPQAVRRVAAGLDALCFPYRIFPPRVPDLLAGPPGAVYCLGSRLASDVPAEVPGPVVVLLSGAQLTDRAVLRIQSLHTSTLQLEGLTPTSLLRAVVSATSGSDAECVAEQILHIARLNRVPRRLVAAFLADPARMTRLTDLRRALAPLSREGAQELVRSTGFSRAEHLFTALRCATWILLRQEGVKRCEVEHYLGIENRTSFRRACGRAGVPALNSRLCVEAFDGAVSAQQQ